MPSLSFSAILRLLWVGNVLRLQRIAVTHSRQREIGIITGAR
jgi:hypothetical protein